MLVFIVAINSIGILMLVGLWDLPYFICLASTTCLIILYIILSLARDDQTESQTSGRLKHYPCIVTMTMSFILHIVAMELYFRKLDTCELYGAECLVV